MSSVVLVLSFCPDEGTHCLQRDAALELFLMITNRYFKPVSSHKDRTITGLCRVIHPFYQFGVFDYDRDHKDYQQTHT